VYIESCYVRFFRSKTNPGTDAMAKGQMKSNKEKKKPKADWNKKKKGAAATAGQAPAKPGHNPFGKKD
jgi:hypothetical protein